MFLIPFLVPLLGGVLFCFKTRRFRCPPRRFRSPLLPTRAKRSKSGSFGDDPTSSCLKTVKICTKTKKHYKCVKIKNKQIFEVSRPGGPLRGPSGAPPGPLRGSSGSPGPSGARRAPPGLLIRPNSVICYICYVFIFCILLCVLCLFLYLLCFSYLLCFGAIGVEGR